MPHDVFISHSAKDKTVADATCGCLEQRGIRCWVAPRDIVAGSDWSASIIDGINGASVMVLILSKHSNISKQVLREIERAANRGIPILPFRVEDIALSKSLEYFLSSAHWLDACDGELQRHLDLLGNNVAQILERDDAIRGVRPAAPERKSLVRMPIFWTVAAAGVLAICGGLFLARPWQRPQPAQATALESAVTSPTAARDEMARSTGMKADAIRDSESIATATLGDGTSQELSSYPDGTSMVTERDAAGEIRSMAFKPGSETFGLGIQIGEERLGASAISASYKFQEGALVTEVPAGGQAARDGAIRAGDLIVAVVEREGAKPIQLQGLFFAEFQRLTAGREGTTIRLLVRREGEPELVALVATRGRMKAVRNRASKSDFTNSIGMEFVAVPGGIGSLGIEDGSDTTMATHYVRLSKGFLIGAHEVTQDEYAAVMNARPSVFSGGGQKAADVVKAHSAGAIPDSETSHHPVDSASWNDATEFCRRLGEKEGRVYRLPTEAEWEWACRNAGAIAWKGFYPGGSGIKEIAVARHLDFPITPHPVGSRTPNEAGIHDMLGNVAEWCADVFADNGFSNAAFVDPRGPSKGLTRVVRGGAFQDNDNAFFERVGLLPTEKRPYIGFRVVLEIKADMLADRDVEQRLLDTSVWQIDESLIPDPIPPLIGPRRTAEDEKQELDEIDNAIASGSTLKQTRARILASGPTNQTQFIEMRSAWMNINSRLGDRRPAQAMELYSAAHGKERRGHGLLEQARCIDPLMGWVNNDIAWGLATEPSPEHRDPSVAVRRAVEACQIVKWQYWGFLDTLAAALAASGRHASALRVAKAALERAPENERPQLEYAIDRYEQGLDWAAQEPQP